MHIFAISPLKHDSEVEFLPADKHKSFLQDGTIFLGVISQTGPKYQNQSAYNIFAISQGKHEEWSWFFASWQMLKVFSNWYHYFRCVWPGMYKLSKITSLLFLYNMFRKKWVMRLIFYMQISMKACYKLILRFFDGYGQPLSKFQKKQVCNVFTISLKRLEMKLAFLMQINIKVSYQFISTLWASKFSSMWQEWSWKCERHGDGNDQAFSMSSK